MSADLTTTYLGLTLECPLIASSSPLTGKLQSLRALAEHGAGAVVLPSLFEEEVTDDDGAPSDALWHTDEHAGEAKAYMANVDLGHRDSYLDLVREAKRELDIPVVASLNGTTAGGWTRTAELLQEAGADAIELNVYAVETDPYASGANVEERTLRLVHAMRQTVSVPIAVKLAPYYTAFANVAYRLADVPVDGLVMFNRFVQPDVDVSKIEVSPGLELSPSRGAPHRSAVARDPPRPSGREPRRDGGRPHDRGRREGDPRRSGRRDDDLGAAAGGRRPPPRRAHRPRLLARRERPDTRRRQGTTQPGRVREPPRIRARAVRRDDRRRERDPLNGAALRPSRGARSRS